MAPLDPPPRPLVEIDRCPAGIRVVGVPPVHDQDGVGIHASRPLSWDLCGGDVVIILRDTKAQEDAESVEEHPYDFAEIHGAADLVPGCHLDRGLDDAESEPMRHDEELCVAGVSLYESYGKDLFEDLASEHLDSGLRVPDLETKQSSEQDLVASAEDPPLPGIVDVGIRMAFGTDDDLRAVCLEHLDEGDNMSRVNVEIPV